MLAFFLALRSWWISAQNDSIANWTPSVVAFTVAIYTAWCKCDRRTVVFASAGTAFILASMLAAEVVAHFSPSDFPRQQLAWEIPYDDPTANVHQVILSAAFAACIGAVTEIVITRFRPWISLNLFALTFMALGSWAMAIAAHFVFAGYAYRFTNYTTFVVAGFLVGAILSTAYVVTYRNFRLP